MKFVLMAYEAKHPNLDNATEGATHLLNIPEAGVLKIDHLVALALVAVQCGLIVCVFVDGNNRRCTIFVLATLPLYMHFHNWMNRNRVN